MAALQVRAHMLTYSRVRSAPCVQCIHGFLSCAEFDSPLPWWRYLMLWGEPRLALTSPRSALGRQSWFCGAVLCPDGPFLGITAYDAEVL
jgi:hypothetical protein